MTENISVSSDACAGFAHTVLKTAKFIFISYVVSCVLIVILALLSVYTDMSESITPIAIKIITLFAAFLSSLLSARHISGKGWLFGFVSGAMNIMILLCLGMLIFKSPVFTSSNLSLMLCGAFSGLVGGIIGVNLGYK